MPVRPEFLDALEQKVTSGEVNVRPEFFQALRTKYEASNQEPQLNDSTGSTSPVGSTKPQEDIDEKQSIFFTALDQVNRTSYGVANAIYHAVVENEYKPSEISKNLWEGLSLKEKKSVGHTLKEVIQPESKWVKAATAAAGFVGDVITDPLSYVGVGLVVRGVKGVGAASKVLVKAGTSAEKFIKAGRAMGKFPGTKSTLTFAGKRIPGTSKYIADPVSRGLAKTGKVLREDLGPVSDLIDKLRAVSPKMRPKGTAPIEWQKYLRAVNKSKNLKKAVEFDTLQKAKHVYKSFKDEGLDDDAIAKITNQIETNQTITSEGGKSAKGLIEDLQAKYKDVGPTGKKIIDDEDISYVPHVLEKKGMKKALGLGSRKYTTKSASDNKRKILKYTDDQGQVFIVTKSGNLYKDGKKVKTLPNNKIKELEDAGQLSQASIAEINKGIGETVFSTKLPQLLAIQGARVAKVIEGDEFFKQIDSVASKTQKPGQVPVTAPELAGKYFDPEIATHIDETYQHLSDPDVVSNVMKGYDNIQNLWKSSATYYNVAFHTRNAISNVWQNSLAGVNNPVDYARAMKIMGKQEFSKGLNAADTKLVNEYRQQGLAKTGWLSGDIDTSMDTQIMSAFDLLKQGFKKGVKSVVRAGSSVKQLSKGAVRQSGRDVVESGRELAGSASSFKGIADKVGGTIGNLVEDQAKLTHFIAKRKDGFSAYDAGESVKKYLFDYEDLTRIEKKVLKRAMPFYTFTRKNIPLQLESLIKNPARQSKLIKAKNNVEILTGEDNASEMLPEWLKDAAPIYVGTKGGKKRYIKLEGFIPSADLDKLSLSNAAKDLLNMVSPVIKAPLEQVANHNFFFGKQITKQKGKEAWGVGESSYGERDLLWTKVPGRIEHLARLFRPISEVEKLFGRKYSDKTALEKAANLFLGGKLYEYSEKDLIRNFKWMTEEEAKGMKKQISDYKRELRKHPERKEDLREDIKTVTQLMRKSKRLARQRQRKARRKLKEE